MTKLERVLRIVAMSVVAVGLSCRDRAPSITSPRSSTGGPTFEFADGAHGGNAHFYFLPPPVSSPAVTGAVDPNQVPAVLGCEPARTDMRPIQAPLSPSTGTAR